ncbi:hypothetical protein CsatB_028244 [Cannabis sativa]
MTTIQQARRPTPNVTPHEINVDVGQDVVSKVREWVKSSGSLDIISIAGTVSFASFDDPSMVFQESFYHIETIKRCERKFDHDEEDVKFEVNLFEQITYINVYHGVVRELLASTPVKITVANYNSPTATSSSSTTSVPRSQH